MKLKLLLVLALFSVLSCDNDLNLVSEYKDIPVVYGILSLPATEQYIRIEKGFIDPAISGLDIAMNPDSLYYEDARVSILENSTGEVFNLAKVDGSEFNLPRDPGIFATDPNYLYRTGDGEFVPVAGEMYTLQIQRSNIDTLVTSSIVMIDPPRIVRPSLTGAASLDFAYNQVTTLKWNGNDNEGLYDLFFEVHYRERNISEGGEFENKSFNWNVTSNYDDVQLELQGINFYGAMASNLEASDNFERRFRYLNMVLSAGGEEVREYVRIGQANSGLTSSQDIPVFSNISEGRGIFSSRHESRNEEIPLTLNTLDSLANGEITRDLNFKI